MRDILISGMAQLDVQRSGRIGIRALTYYSVTTILAAIVGIAMVLMIHPGDPKIKTTVTAMVKAEETKVSTVDAILDIIRYGKTASQFHYRDSYPKFAIFRSQKHDAGEPGASMLPAGSDFLRKEESTRNRLESKRVHTRIDLGLQGRYERDGHDCVLHYLRRARGPDRTSRQADGGLFCGAKRNYHETRLDRCDLV